MAAPAPSVTAYFDLTAQGGAYFTLDDPVKGLLDNATYLLAGDLATDISQYIRSVQIRRGRERTLDEITAGVATVVGDNRLRTFDPEYTAGPYYGNIRPGKRVTIAAAGVTVFDGLIDDWDYEYQVEGDSTVTFDVADALASLAAKEFDAWTTTAGQLPGARLTSILNRPEVNYPANRDLDVGSSTLQADLVSWGSNVLNYAQLVVKADLGQLFASRDGVLTFYGRNRTVTGVGAPEFRDDGTGIEYAGITVDYGTELLFNRVSVDATGFTKQTVTDATSIDLYGVRSLSIASLPLDSQAQALDMASYLLSLYKAPSSRFSSITLLLHGLEPSDQATVLSLDIGSVVRVVYTPNGSSTYSGSLLTEGGLDDLLAEGGSDVLDGEGVGDAVPAIDKFCMVEGISHLMGPAFHSVTLSLSNLADGFSGQPFILDDAEFGLLDGVGVLAF